MWSTSVASSFVACVYGNHGKQSLKTPYGEVWKHVGTSTRAGGADHRDKLLCGACWLTEMPAGMSNTKAS
jgi:hypothetical protein